MPELPEIEIVKKSLFKMINKAEIIDIKISGKKLRYKITNTFFTSLVGEKILNISRRSKYLLFHFKNKILLAHLGMSGKLLVRRRNDNRFFKTSFYYDMNFPEKHNHLKFILSNDLELIYNDVRRFGFFKLYNTTQVNKISFLKKLGLEPFSRKFNLYYFKKFTLKKKKNIKSLLMDQTFVSGLGNIYVNEILFLSKVIPLRECNKLKKNEIINIILSTKKILKSSISQGGSSIKDFKNVTGNSGNFQQFFHVYGQEGKKCSRISCKGEIKKIVISNRSTFYCNKCQI